MSRYVDINRLEPQQFENSEVELGVLAYDYDEVDAMPFLDIVFCEDCRDCVEKGVGVDCPSGYGYLYCRRKKSVVDEDDYCSWGVRR